MALGALSLVDSSGVVLDSGSAMQPVGANSGSQLQTMSPADTMKEVFFDIRDGISNLSKTFSEKISGLNKHLAFRLDKLNTTMTTIGKIAVKDLGLEQVQTKIAKENEIEAERRESVGDQGDPKKDEGKGFLTDSFKDKFGSLIDKLTPKTQLGKIGLAGLALGGVVAGIGQIEDAFAGTAKFIKEKVAPKAKIAMTEIKKDFASMKENFFGKEGFFPIIGKGISDIVDGINEGDTTKIKSGLKTTFIDGTVKLAAAIGESAVGGLDTLLKTMGFDVDLDSTQKWFKDLPDNIDGYVRTMLDTAQGVIDDVKKTYDKKGFLAATKVGALGLFDNTVALAGNFLADASGAIAGHFGDEESAKKLKALEFSSENFMKSITDLGNMIYNSEEGTIFGLNFRGLTDMLPTLQEIADSIVMSLPKWMRPDTIGEKIFETQQKIQFEKDQIASGDMRDGFLNKRTDNIKELESELSDLEASLPEGYKVDIKKMDTTSGSSIESGTTLKSVAEIRSTTGAPSNITIMKGGDTKADKTQVFQGDNIHFSKRINGLGTADAVLDQIK